MRMFALGCWSVHGWILHPVHQGGQNQHCVLVPSPSCDPQACASLVDRWECASKLVHEASNWGLWTECAYGNYVCVIMYIPNSCLLFINNFLIIIYEVTLRKEREDWMEPIIHSCGFLGQQGEMELCHLYSRLASLLAVCRYACTICVQVWSWIWALELFSVPIRTVVLGADVYYVYIVPAEFCGCDYQQIFPHSTAACGHWNF